MDVRRRFLEFAHRMAGSVTTYDAWQRFQFLSQCQWWSLEKLKAYQWRRLQETISHAYDNVPFYHSLWKRHRITPKDIKKPGDVQLLPTIRREEIDRERCFAIKNVSKKGLSIVTTSGSTGEPFSVYIDLPAYQSKYALWLREFSFADCHLGKKVASFWHRSYRGYMKQEPHALLRDIIWSLSGKRIFPPLPTDANTVMNPEQGLVFYKEFRNFHPFLVESLQFFILILTNFILDNDLDPVPVSKMFMHGMPSVKDRKKVERAFPGVEIFDRYSSHEFEGIACECSEHRGMHISVDSYLVEFMREDNTMASPGEIGRIIITDLDNKAMPLIRYEIRDMGCFLDRRCSCGRGLPLMASIAGRENEYIMSAGGGKYYFSFFRDFFDQFDEVRYFQLYQRGGGMVEVRIVKDRSIAETVLAAKVGRELEEILGNEVTVKYVPFIEEEKNGKILPIKRQDW